MADSTISNLTALTGANTSNNDQLVIVDVDALPSETKKILVSEFYQKMRSSFLADDVSLQCEGMTAGVYGSSTNLAWDVISGKDTKSGWSGDAYTVQTGDEGWYIVEGTMRLSTATSALYGRYLNGSLDKYTDSVSNLIDHNITDLVYLEEGDVLSYRPASNITVVDDATRTWLNLKRLN